MMLDVLLKIKDEQVRWTAWVLLGRAPSKCASEQPNCHCCVVHLAAENHFMLVPPCRTRR